MKKCLLGRYTLAPLLSYFSCVLFYKNGWLVENNDILSSIQDDSNHIEPSGSDIDKKIRENQLTSASHLKNVLESAPGVRIYRLLYHRGRFCKDETILLFVNVSVQLDALVALSKVIR